MTKFIIWDIDGVFSPTLSWNLTAENGWERISEGWAVWMLNRGLHAPLLAEFSQKATNLWGSNWAEASNGINRQFSVEPFSHIPLRSSEAGSWKLPSIEAWRARMMKPGDTVVWVDDELYRDADDWANKHAGVHLLKTDPSLGFTEGDAVQLRNLLA